MWASSWALNGFLYDGLQQDTVCHSMEHELSAFYDITHGHGLAILTPRWLGYILDEETAPRIKRFGVNVMGVDAGLSDMDGAKAAIKAMSEFYFDTLGLKSRLSDLGIDDSKFELMAKKPAVTERSTLSQTLLQRMSKTSTGCACNRRR